MHRNVARALLRTVPSLSGSFAFRTSAARSTINCVMFVVMTAVEGDSIQTGDPTPADGILDRLVHNAHRFEMRGDSMRENRGKPNA